MLESTLQVSLQEAKEIAIPNAYAYAYGTRSKPILNLQMYIRPKDLQTPVLIKKDVHPTCAADQPSPVACPLRGSAWYALLCWQISGQPFGNRGAVAVCMHVILIFGPAFKLQCVKPASLGCVACDHQQLTVPDVVEGRSGARKGSETACFLVVLVRGITDHARTTLTNLSKIPRLLRIVHIELIVHADSFH